jgi:hypothetical protein
MELVSEVVLLGIVKSPVTSPVITSFGSLNRTPFRLVLTSNLVPEFIIRCYATPGLYLSAGCDVSQKLVWVR